MKQVLAILALEIAVGLALLAQATITNPNNNKFTGTTTFTGHVAGAHGQDFGTGDVVTFAGVNSSGVYSSVGSGAGPGHQFSCSGMTAGSDCVYISQSSSLSNALVVSGSTILADTDVSGALSIGSLAGSTTAGDVACLKHPGGIGFATTIGYAHVSAGLVGTCN